jgi:transglutaminase-like putative cysteine protease
MEEEIIEEPWYKGPIRWILGLFLILIILLWLVPTYSIKLDPSPSYIPLISETFPGGNETKTKNTDQNNLDYLRLVEPVNPAIKQTANKIVSLSGCKDSKVCNAKAIFYFVQRNINYVNDPINREYLATAIETLDTGVGDCDDFSILLSNLLQSIGIKTRFIFIPGHVFVQAYLPEAMKKYKFEDSWINLDATCSNCEFGEITYSTNQADKRYLG